MTFSTVPPVMTQSLMGRVGVNKYLQSNMSDQSEIGFEETEVKFL